MADLFLSADVSQLVESRREITTWAKQTRDAIDIVNSRMQVLGATSPVALNKFGGSAQVATRGMNRMGMITQQAGYQIGDFLVQVQSGTNGFVAFGQQATQLVGLLGLMNKRLIGLGAALGIIIPLVTVVGATLSRTGAGGKAFDELRQSLEVIAPLMDTVADGFSALKDAAITGVNILVNNLDRLIITGGLVASFFAIKFVKSFVAARIATLSLAGALTTLRVALIRTGIGALVVGAGELVYQFSRLYRATGSLGGAFSALFEVSKAVFLGIIESATALPLALQAYGQRIKADWNLMLSDLLSSFSSFLQGIANRIPNVGPLARVGQEISNAATSVMGVSGDFATTAAEASAAAERLGNEASSVVAGGFNRIKEALASLKKTSDEIDIRDWFGGSADDGGGGLETTLTDAEKRIQSVADALKSSMSEGFMAMVDGTKSVKDAFKDMARSIIRQLYDILVVQQLVGSFDVDTQKGSGIVGAIMGAFGGGRASGGMMSPNTPYLVGERGPELVMPRRQSTVMNADLTAKAMGGGESVNVTQVFNINGNGDEYIMGKIAQAAPKIADVTKQSILNERRRGGVYKSVFG